MIRDEVKDMVVGFVEDAQGCKATEVCAVPELIVACGVFSLSALIEELVKEGRLVEVEYTVPDIDWRLKSFLLPPGSKITAVREVVETWDLELGQHRNGPALISAKLGHHQSEKRRVRFPMPGHSCE